MGGRIDGVKIGCEGFEVPVEVWPLTTEPSDLQAQYFNISSNLELFVAKLKSKGYLFHFSMFFYYQWFVKSFAKISFLEQ